VSSPAKTWLFLGGAIFLIGLVLANAVLSVKGKGRAVPKKVFAKEIGEPSGMAFLPDKECLVVVGDEGQIAEVSLEGEVRFLRNLGDDLEGVTFDPDHNVLFVIDEKTEEILVVDPEEYKVLDSLPLRRISEEAGLPKDRNDSFEGVAYESTEKGHSGILWLGHQRRPALLVRLEIEGSPIRVKTAGALEVDLPEISGLCLDPRSGEMWILCDIEDACSRISNEGEILEKIEVEGQDQEGLAILPNGDWWIADDAGGIFRAELAGR